MKQLFLIVSAMVLLALTACGNTGDVTTTTPILTKVLPPLVVVTTPTPLSTTPPEQPVLSSEFTQQHLEDFLSNFLTLTDSFGFLAGDGTYRDFAHNQFETRPLVVWERLGEYPWVAYFDRLGNRIVDSPCIVGEGFATDFALYDLGNNGIPDIVIRWGIPETCAAFRHLFRFADGEYRYFGTIKDWYNFFHDPDGQLIVLYDSALTGTAAYYFLHFNDNSMQHEPLFDDTELDFQEWMDHHWNEEFAANPTIIGTDIPLTPVLPLTELHAEILQAIRLYHGV